MSKPLQSPIRKEWVYLGIGSNINRIYNITKGLLDLKNKFGEIRLSPVYRSKAYGFRGQDFYNLVACLKCNYQLPRLKRELKQIEAKFGRKKTPAKFTSRTLDIDILLYGNLITKNVPHSDITRLAFMLKPLSDLAPDLIHPLTGQSFADIWKTFDSSKQPLTNVHWYYSL